MSKSDTLSFLAGLQRFGWKLGLETMTKLLQRLGNPHEQLRSIHIAGTNGKGSTAAILESLFRAGGYKTGLYTSPHLVDVTERIRVNAQPIPESIFRRYLSQSRRSIEELSCTYYEALTAVAMQYFCDQQVDWAIFEVGLGGRFDATNVIRPEITIITEVSLDHTEYLGKTLFEIAGEKAGILKPKIPCVCQAQDPEALLAIENRASALNVPLLNVAEHCRIVNPRLCIDACQFDLHMGGRRYPNLRLSLPGEHQLNNAAAAILAFDRLRSKGQPLSRAVLAHAVDRVRWPGRLQLLQRRPDIVVDVAHNARAMHSLFRSLKQLYGGQRLLVVVGLLKDKQFCDIAKIIARHADVVFVTSPESERALPAETLASEFRKYAIDVICLPERAACFGEALAFATETDLLCVTGSHYVAGEFLLFNKNS